MVSLVTRDQVHVQMEHCLAGGLASVDADVPGVGGVVFLDFLAGRCDGLGEGLLFFGRGVEPVGDMPAWDQQGVAGADRVAVPQAQGQVGFEEDLVGVGMAEWAGHVVG